VIWMDTLMVSGLRWVLDTVAQAALAEFRDDTPLREALLEAGVRLELGEISQEEFTLLEDQLLARINAIRALQEEPAAGPIAFPGSSPEAGDETLQVEAGIVGDFHEARAVHEPAAPQHERPRRKRRGVGAA